MLNTTGVGGLDSLSPFCVEVLEHLPGESNGLTVEELADGLLGKANKRNRAKVSYAIRVLTTVLGGLYIRQCTVWHGGGRRPKMYGIPARTIAQVRAWFRVHTVRVEVTMPVVVSERRRTGTAAMTA